MPTQIGSYPVNGCFRVAFSVLSGPVKKAYDNCIAEFRKETNHRTIDYKVLSTQSCQSLPKQRTRSFSSIQAAPATFRMRYSRRFRANSTEIDTKGVKRGDNVILMELAERAASEVLPFCLPSEDSGIRGIWSGKDLCGQHGTKLMHAWLKKKTKASLEYLNDECRLPIFTKARRS